MSDRDELAALIRRTVAQADDHIPEGYWWYDGGQDGELPEALAADLLTAGWRRDTYAAPEEASQRERPAEYSATGTTDDGRQWWI